MIPLSGGSHRLTGDLVLMGYVRAMSSQLDVFIAARMRDTTRLPVGPPPGSWGLKMTESGDGDEMRNGRTGMERQR